MELSLQQTADILGKTRRQILHDRPGKITRQKERRTEAIDRADLQVDEAMQQRTSQKRARFRAVVEDALPRRLRPKNQ
jgi:hypothetical protein